MDLPVQPPKIYTVSQLTWEIKSLLEGQFSMVWLEGEISNLSCPASGHFYMSLKDEHAQIRSVMFKPQARCLKFIPEDGMMAIARGRIGVYEPRGEYQIILDYLEPLGVGALAAAFEQVKGKLAREGIFDADQKRPIPFLPQRIAVITSPTGAAIRDFLRIAGRRMANLDITIIPVRVQGDEAARDIVEALGLVNQELPYIQVIVLTRGGGSLEDLWPFNQEEVAYAIRRSDIPVVSAVGHEVDLTISDLAADLRAPTPSGAAELLVRESAALTRELKSLSSRLDTALEVILRTARDRMKNLSARIRDPRRRLADAWLRLDAFASRLFMAERGFIRDKRAEGKSAHERLLVNTPSHAIAMWKQEMSFHTRALGQAISGLLEARRRDAFRFTEKLESLSPLSILNRGYSITRKLPDMTIIKDSAQVSSGSKIDILLAHGSIIGTVSKTDKGG
ncbi:MAG: exodeoxyribonuclease VII large subunit [Thermodesulfobacteriota bacterium]